MESTNNIKFESGREYSFSQLCKGENKIVIPDLQRDYCWGDKAWNKDVNTNSEIVSQFLEQLWQLYQQNSEQSFTLGMIYGYEHPRYNINLCDGQQRLTTLYLLLGMINRVSKNEFKKYLISDNELMQDDKEPYLQYAIRESSLYFLSDLVVKFFLENNVAVDDITKQPWYFSEYDSDATITSMRNALGIIENFLKKDKIEDNVVEFGEYIVNKIKFLYYDMGSRQNGEETFVVINTTGEPLSASENIKPLLLGYIKDEAIRRKYSCEWEEREEWFWHNRRQKGKEKEATADDAYLDFFKWFFSIKLKQKQYKEKNIDPKQIFWEKREKYGSPAYLNMIHRYFKALQRLLEICSADADVRSVLHSIDINDLNLDWFRGKSRDIILPLICYLHKFEDHKMFHRFVRRVRKNWFDKKREGLERHKSFLDWRYLVTLIEKCANEDDVFTFDTKSLEKIQNVDLPQWYDDNEIFIKHIEQELGPTFLREKEDNEEYKDFMGDFTVIRKAVGENPSHEKIESVFNKFRILFECMQEKTAREPELSNFYRLFKVYIGCPGIKHISYTRSLTGARFSWVDREDNSYFNYMNHPDFSALLKSDDMLAYIKQYIRDHTKYDDVFFGNENYSTEIHLKSWLLLKVLCCGNNLLTFHDGRGGRGISVYEGRTRNLIDPKIQLSIANTICGYSYNKSDVIYATDDNWDDQTRFDTMFVFDKNISRVEFDKIKRGDSMLTAEYIESTERKLKEIFKAFMTKEIPTQ